MGTNKKYECGVVGVNLFEAIGDSGDSRGSPPIMEDWVEGQAKEYMGPEWDHMRIGNIIWDMRNMDILEALKKEGLSIDDGIVFDGTKSDKDGSRGELWDCIDRKTLKRFCKKYNFKELYDAFEEDMDGERLEWAYDRGWDDHNTMSEEDLDVEDDIAVAQFYGISSKFYEVDVIDYPENDEMESIDKCFCCPSCDDWVLIEDQKEDQLAAREYYDSKDFICHHCGYEVVIDNDFINTNSHLSKWELIARVV